MLEDHHSHGHSQPENLSTAGSVLPMPRKPVTSQPSSQTPIKPFHKTHQDTQGHVYTPVDKPAVEDAVRSLLAAVGEDPNRDGVLGTPDRIARMYTEVLGGYTMDPVKVVNGALFDVEYQDVVLVKNIQFYSLCEHHMLPFHGTATVAYIPSDKVIGLSKIPRIVNMFARRLQVQERMTKQIADFIDETLNPQAVAVFVEGVHLCASMRGVRSPHSRMVTRYFLGDYKENPEMRRELSDLIGPVGPQAFI